jgi:hypothetical protein
LQQKKKTAAEEENLRGGDSTWVFGLGIGPGMDRSSPLGTHVRINYKND